MDIVGVSYPTVFNWYARFRQHIPDISKQLQGSIACDELYTKHQAVIGAKQKGTRNIALRVVHQSSVDRRMIVDFLVHHVKPDSELCTDGAAIYKRIDNWHRLQHRYEIHRRFKFSLTAEIEGLWGVFRTWIRRMYHHVTRYKLEDLVAEFVLRFSQHKVFENPYVYWQECLGRRPFAL
jgi:hypothetical protein